MKQYRKTNTHVGLGQKKRRLIANITIYVILILMSLLWLFPFVCLLLDAFRCEYNEGVFLTGQQGHLWPKNGLKGFGFTNFKNLFIKNSFTRWYVNTLIISIFTAVFQTLFVLSMSYTLSRLRFKGRTALMKFMLILGMFPGLLSMILLYKLLSDWGMTGNFKGWNQLGAVPGLIIVYVASSGMGYYVSKGYFDTIPKSLDEAARVDGATRFQVFKKIIIPLSKPIVIYTVLMGFMGPWGDFMLASYISHYDDKSMNVATALQNMISSPGAISAHYGEFCAAGVLVAIPITTLFMFLQKYYVEGVTGGAVKG